VIEPASTDSATGYSVRMARKTYVAGNVEVSFDKDLCFHAEECVHGLPKVFDPDARPWIKPENATAAELEEVVSRCPSGALAFRLRGAAEAAGARPSDAKPAAQATPGSTPTAPSAASASSGTRVLVHAMPDGPLIVEGAVTVRDASGAVLREADRVSLCRCGASASKPFCDGAHGRAGFHAP
jgi:uncharacterized Fe-S cluster protein YjdI